MNNQEVNLLIYAIPSAALVIVTALYLLETKKMRKLQHRSFQIDVSPKVFIYKIHTQQRLDAQARKLLINPEFKSINKGKAEAKRPQFFWKVFLNNEFFQEGSSKPAPHIFPDQPISFDDIGIFVTLDQKWVEHAQKILIRSESRGDKDLKINLPNNFKPSIKIEIHIKYFDHDNKEQRVSYLCDYRWHLSNWGYELIEKKKESLEIPRIKIWIRLP